MCRSGSTLPSPRQFLAVWISSTTLTFCDSRWSNLAALLERAQRELILHTVQACYLGKKIIMKPMPTVAREAESTINDDGHIASVNGSTDAGRETETEARRSGAAFRRRLTRLQSALLLLTSQAPSFNLQCRSRLTAKTECSAPSIEHDLR